MQRSATRRWEVHLAAGRAHVRQLQSSPSCRCYPGTDLTCSAIARVYVSPLDPRSRPSALITSCTCTRLNLQRLPLFSPWLTCSEGVPRSRAAPLYCTFIHLASLCGRSYTHTYVYKRKDADGALGLAGIGQFIQHSCIAFRMSSPPFCHACRAIAAYAF